jgi:hypothetical protein
MTLMEKAVKEAKSVINKLDKFSAFGRLSANDKPLRMNLGRIAKRYGTSVDALLSETMWQVVPPLRDSEPSTKERVEMRMRKSLVTAY